MICPNCRNQELKYFEKENSLFCEYCGYSIELNKKDKDYKPVYIG